MAEKILNTRLILKHGELAALNASDIILKKGEVALASITTGNVAVPTFLMKVGDGSKKFSELNWLAAPASDVYAWAKKENLALEDIPTMDAAHIPQLEIAKINGLATRLSNIENAIGEGGSVAEAIENAINALDVTASSDADGVVIASIEQADGKIAVTRRALVAADIPELAIAKITGLQDALDAKVATSTFTTRVAGIETSINDEVTNRKAEDAKIQKAVDDLAAAIGNVTNIMNFRGAVAAKSAITDPVEGDVICVTDGDDAGKEFVYSDGEWVEFGSVTAQDAAISALKTRMDSAEAAIATKAEKSELTAAQTTLQGNIDAVAKDVSDNKKAFDDHVSAYNTKVEALEAADTKNAGDIAAAVTRIATAEGKLTTIEGSGDGSIAKALADAKAYADQAEATAVSTAAADAAAKVKALEDGQVATNKTDIASLTTRVANIENDYLKAADTYIFDCGEVTAD